MENVNQLNEKDVKETLREKLIRYFAILLIILCPIFFLISFKVVKQYKRAIVLRFGRVRGDSPAGPGIIWVIPCTDNTILFDLRTQSFNLLPQEILTRDSVTVTVDAVIYYHVVNPLSCLLRVQSFSSATSLLAISTLRNILGQHKLSELLTSREVISLKVREEIDKHATDWGIQVERVEIKDVILPFELQRAMAAEAEGTRIAKGKIIEAEGEIKAAQNLRDASRMMLDKPQTMILRYLQTLNYMTTEQKTSIIFPFPIEIPNPSSTHTYSSTPYSTHGDSGTPSSTHKDSSSRSTAHKDSSTPNSTHKDNSSRSITHIDTHKDSSTPSTTHKDSSPRSVTYKDSST